MNFKFNKNWKHFKFNTLRKGVLFTGANSQVIKYVLVPVPRICNVIKIITILIRLYKIKVLRPEFLNQILEYRFYYQHFSWVQLKLEYLPGRPLSSIPEQSLIHVTSTAINFLISKITSFKFIHGDLHPENILYHNGKLYLIDWLVCLKSDCGHPRYTELTTLVKGRTLMSELKALKQIFS